MVTTLVIDVGTTSLRTALVNERGDVEHVCQERLSVTSPQPGEVELDGSEIARLALRCATETLSLGGPAQYVAIANQRATTVLFDAATAEPVGPVLGWQDLRTVIDCLVLQGEGVHLAPNQTATKAKWLLEHTEHPRANLKLGTLETYLAYVLTEGRHHVTDHSNVAVTGLVHHDASRYDQRTLELLGIDEAMLPRIVPTASVVGEATALPGAPTLVALIGDQQSSLFGQNCVRTGQTKITFGTGSMLNQVAEHTPSSTLTRFASGCFPVVLRSRGEERTWGVEGIALSSGTCVEWLRDDLGLIGAASETEVLARSVPDSGGVSFVPALVGLGTPQWDFGARAAFFGLTRGSTKAHLVRAVLEGIAHNAVDLIDAAEAETGVALTSVRVDGGMVANGFLTQALADASGRVVEISAQREATTRGAGLMALWSIGELSLDDVEHLWVPSAVVEPTSEPALRAQHRERWADARRRAEKTIPELSAVSF